MTPARALFEYDSWYELPFDGNGGAILEGGDAFQEVQGLFCCGTEVQPAGVMRGVSWDRSGGPEDRRLTTGVVCWERELVGQLATERLGRVRGVGFDFLRAGGADFLSCVSSSSLKCQDWCQQENSQVNRVKGAYLAPAFRIRSFNPCWANDLESSVDSARCSDGWVTAEFRGRSNGTQNVLLVPANRLPL